MLCWRQRGDQVAARSRACDEQSQCHAHAPSFDNGAKGQRGADLMSQTAFHVWAIPLRERRTSIAGLWILDEPAPRQEQKAN